MIKENNNQFIRRPSHSPADNLLLMIIVISVIVIFARVDILSIIVVIFLCYSYSI